MSLNLFEMAELHLQNTKGDNYTGVDVIDIAERIRAFMDKHPRLSAQLLRGENMSRQLKYWYKNNGGLHEQV